MWKLRANIFPVINGTSGKINKGLDKNIQLLPRQPPSTELQKFTIMSTANINLKVLG